MGEEEWRPINEVEGAYEVSSLGRVRRTSTGRVLKPDLVKGYHRYSMSLRNHRVRRTAHRLVAAAWHGEPSEGYWALHRNDNPLDNRPENLYWGTPKENTRDAVVNGGHRNVQKTHCPNGHPYNEENTLLFRGYQRRCKECSKAWASSSRRKRRERGLPDPNDPRHGTTTGYGSYGCKCDLCMEAMREYEKTRKGWR